MAKYRLLNQKELEELQKEFIDYLVVNGITADEWERLKQENKPEADQIIDLFSDVVFEGILRKTKFIEHRSDKQILAFQCLPEKLVLVGVKGHGVDFSNLDFLKDTTTDLEVFTAEKSYTESREKELFQMLEEGGEIADGKLFKQLCLML